MTSKTPTSDYILNTSKEFSIYVCSSRAIPSVTDGLKNGQRKALYLMMGHNSKVKTISLSGEMIQTELYVHGDASASDTISKLAAPYQNNVPLLDGVGAFGTRVDPYAVGAPRYTYVKKSSMTEKLLYTDKDLIPMVENFSGNMMEPITFLPIIPLVLLNGVSGIAVGWSTNILPRSLKDLVQATKDALQGKKVEKIIPSYDKFDVDIEEIEDNSYEIKGKVSIKDTSTVLVTELPPDLSLEKFKDKLDRLEEGKIINGYIDNSTKHIHIEVKFRRDDLKNLNENQLIDLLKLKAKKTERIVVIDWNGKSIKQYENAETLIEEFVKWRFNFYVDRYQKLFNDDNNELNYWKGVKLCFDKDLPSQLNTARDKKHLEEMIVNITSSLNLDDKQVDKISQFPSYRWSKDNYKNVQNKIKELESQIKKYEKMLKNHSLIVKEYEKELDAISI